MKQITETENKDWASLFDHLGKAAGPELGEKVYIAAKKAKQPIRIRHVSNKNYEGKIILYSPLFLNEYFNGK